MWTEVREKMDKLVSADDSRKNQELFKALFDKF